MRLRIPALICSSIVSVLVVARPARADMPPSSLAVQPLDEESPLGSGYGTRWRSGEDRWFLATRVDAGFFFLRPRASFGYGRPHFDWLGFDAVPIVSTSALGGYLGVRLQQPWFEIHTGGLHQYSFNRSYLDSRPHHDRRDIDVLQGERASYTLWESELEIDAPLGPLSLLSKTQALYAGGIPEDKHLYLDTLHVVITSGWTVRQRIGVEWFIPGTTIGIAPLAELVWLDERRAAVVRAGLGLRWVLTDELHVRTFALPVVSSPDTLGRLGGDILEISLRWFWATD